MGSWSIDSIYEPMPSGANFQRSAAGVEDFLDVFADRKKQCTAQRYPEAGSFGSRFSGDVRFITVP